MRTWFITWGWFASTVVNSFSALAWIVLNHNVFVAIVPASLAVFSTVAFVASLDDE